MDITSYIRFILALIVVIGMIFAVTWVMKRLGVGQNQLGALGRKRRLRTVESANIDGRHRLVLVRRDAVEHLVLLGPTTSQVIETGIPAPSDDSPPSESKPGGFSFKSLLNAASPSAKDTAP
jgi:flagellar protein FliO/FliZ